MSINIIQGLMKKYMHFISLGYFCSVALELEKMGLRSCSSPFDWCISEWGGVEKAITLHFKDFLSYEKLYQKKKEPYVYKNKEYGISFHHDFNEFETLEKQIEQVRKKYERRIERFYQNITEPTLFIRYISTEPSSQELNYIESNYNKIIDLLKSYNRDNEIIFIINDNVRTRLRNTYYVKKDNNDVVARKPFKRNRALFYLLNRLEYYDKKDNIKKYKRKKIKKIMLKLFDICKRKNKSWNCKKYVHDKQYEMNETETSYEKSTTN